MVARGHHPHLSYLPTDDLYELNSAGFSFPSLGRLKFTADGKLLLTDAAGAGSPMLLWGGITDQFPGIKRASSALSLRKADDSGAASLFAAAITTNGILTVGSGHILMDEITDAAAPAADMGVIYFREGAGSKTELVARFPTGAIQQLAIEP